jgi:signal transduction histidine kinase
VPIRYREKTFGLVQLNDNRAGIFTIEVILMWERLAGYLAIAISKFHAEADFHKSEERFKYLFENMVEGFAYCMMLYDNGNPVDFVYINVNEKFEQLTGLKNAIGKKVTHLIPGIKESNPELFEIYNRVASTGIPERFEDYIPLLDMWFSISVYSPKKEFFVAVFDVITERKRAEEEIIKSRTQYRELAAHLQTVREEERTAIAREMHDELGQILSSIKMNLVLIHRQVEDRENTNYVKILSEIDSLNKTIDNAVARVRKLITQLRPELLDKLGLIPALEWYIQEYNKEVKIKCRLFSECDECHLDNENELAIFRIIQESLLSG